MVVEACRSDVGSFCQVARPGITYVVTVGWLANACVESTSGFAMELGYRIATSATNVEA
jgi:hypothetical protein